MKKYNPEYIDDEEKNIVESIESVNLRDISKPGEEEQTEIRNAAKDYIKKDTSI